jgi:hypothetical protein
MILVGISKGKSSLGRPRRSLKENVKRVLKLRMYGPVSSGSEREPAAGSCEHGSER